jgi:hypothetical protein
MKKLSKILMSVGASVFVLGVVCILLPAHALMILEGLAWVSIFSAIVVLSH